MGCARLLVASLLLAVAGCGSHGSSSDPRRAVGAGPRVGAVAGSHPAIATGPRRLLFAESHLALGRPATSIDTALVSDASSLAVGQQGQLALVAVDDEGRAKLAGTVPLDPGTDVSGVLEIEPQDESKVPAGDLFVSDRAGGRLIRVRRTRGRWHTAAVLSTGAAPASPFGSFGAHPELRSAGVVAAGADAVSLFRPTNVDGWRLAGRRTVGRRPVAAVPFGLPDSGDGAVAVVNAGSDSLSILSGDGLRRRRDIAVGREPSAVAAWDIDEAVTVAVADSGSSSVSIVVLRYQRRPLVRTIRLPGTRPVAVALDRIDRDDKVDLAVADAAGRRVMVLNGRSAGEFTLGTTLALPDEPVDMLANDLLAPIAVVGRSGILSVFVLDDDQQLGGDGVGIAAHDGRVLWSVRSGVRYRLVQRHAGATAPLAGVGPSTRPIRVRFGRAPDGRLAASYLRCDRAGCTPFRYDFGRSRETALRALAVPRGCEVTDVAAWERQTAYVLSHGPSCPSSSRGVWLQRAGARRRLGGGFRNRLGGLTGRLLGWSEWRGHGWGAAPRIRLADTRTGRVRTVYRGDPSEYDAGYVLTGPLIDGNSLYWASVGTSSIAVEDVVRLYRQVGARRARCLRHVTRTDDRELGIYPDFWPVVDFAVDRGQIFYVAHEKPFVADMSRLAPRLSCSGSG
jgi:hypothetical protein